MAQRGRALEKLCCYLFGAIPGIEIAMTNKLNAFETEEIDIAFWNEQHRDGLWFLPTLILVECKNWSSAVGSQEVSYFVSRLAERGCNYGILVATQGVTGSAADLTRSHFILATALSRGIRALVISRAEIESLPDTARLVRLLKEKLCELTVSGTNL